MSIFKQRQQVQALLAAVNTLKATVESQAFIIDDITTAQKASATYKGNEYPSYETAIAALAQKYEGTADWGVLQTGNIIDVRSAFIIGQGIQVYPKDKEDGKEKAKAEMDFVQRFLEFNDIDLETAQEFAKEAELEGCFLGQLIWDKEDEMVSVRFRSRAQYKYKIETDPNDYAWYKKATWDEGSIPKKLEEGEFVYGRFGGRAHQPNLPYPKVAKCLSQIEALDKALRDWREINHLFAAPVPDIECATAEQAQKMNAQLPEMMKNYRLRKLVIHTGKFSYITPNMTVIDTLEKEIITLAKMISGTTGTPVHFLGLPDLMSNRSTAENLMELVSASTSKERLIWKGLFHEIIKKAMAMWADKSGKTKLDPELVTVEIPFITQEQWDRIASTYLPLYQEDALTLKTLLSKVPGINVDEELKALEDQAGDAIEGKNHDPDAHEGEDEIDDEEDLNEGNNNGRRNAGRPAAKDQGLGSQQADLDRQRRAGAAGKRQGG